MAISLFVVEARILDLQSNNKNVLKTEFDREVKLDKLGDRTGAQAAATNVTAHC